MNKDITYLKKNPEQKIEILNKIISDFLAQNLIPKIGIELEFYLLNPDNSFPETALIDKFIIRLNQQLHSKNIPVKLIEKEQGASQIEIKTLPCLDILSLCSDILLTKEIIRNLAKEFLLKASFESQPFKDDCGSALQINLSLTNSKNHYLFAKNNISENSILLNSVGGIIELIHDLIIFCAPEEKDYLRYDRELNRELFKKGKFTAPINASWGYNNRTAAVRIPSNKDDERRIEFRLAAANADVYLVIASLLIAIEYGIKNKITPPEALYGNAFDEKYQFKSLFHQTSNIKHTQ